MGKTFVEVDEDGECIFFGRVTECGLEFDLDKSITASGILNELENIQTKFGSGTHDTTSQVLTSVLSLVMSPNQATKDYSPVNCMVRGNVTVANKKVSSEDTGDQFGSYWSILTNYLLENDKAKDGYLKLRLANDPGTEDYFFYYDYLMPEDVPTTSQTIEYGVNMLDLTYEEKRSSELVNSITAHGTTTETHGFWIFKSTTYDTTSATWSDPLSIAEYGLLSKHIYVDGKKNTEDSLYEAAEKESENYKQIAEPTLTVKAFDRKDAGEDVDKLGYMLRTHIISKPHGIDRWMVCTGARLPLDAPDNKEFTFGLTSAKLSSLNKKYEALLKQIKDAMAGLISFVTN